MKKTREASKQSLGQRHVDSARMGDDQLTGSTTTNGESTFVTCSRRDGGAARHATLRAIWRRIAGYRNLGRICYVRVPSSGPKHDLDTDLIVSLTSYPPRFSLLHLTIRSLLSQSIRPDKIILWLAERDIEQLPVRVRRLCANGLEIQLCADVGSYKKIVPALAAYPSATIVIADDDVMYEAHWLRDLVSASRRFPNDVIAHRARLMTFASTGCVAPYKHWKVAKLSYTSSGHYVPTGVGGVLYPPGSLPPAAVLESLFEKMAKNADDLWLFWMFRQNSRICRLTFTPHEPVPWPGSQRVALWSTMNLKGKSNNDRVTDALITAFGLPKP